MKGHTEKEIRKVRREGELGVMEFMKGNVTGRGARLTVLTAMWDQGQGCSLDFWFG